jgi:hypothetical protein
MTLPTTADQRATQRRTMKLLLAAALLMLVVLGAFSAPLVTAYSLDGMRSLHSSSDAAEAMPILKAWSDTQVIRRAEEFLVADVLFIGLYGWLLVSLARYVDWTGRGQGRAWRVIAGLILLTCVLDVMENGIAALLIRKSPNRMSDSGFWLMSFAYTAKFWLLGACLAGTTVLDILRFNQRAYPEAPRPIGSDTDDQGPTPGQPAPLPPVSPRVVPIVYVPPPYSQA